MRALPPLWGAPSLRGTPAVRRGRGRVDLGADMGVRQRLLKAPGEVDVVGGELELLAPPRAGGGGELGSQRPPGQQSASQGRRQAADGGLGRGVLLGDVLLRGADVPDAGASLRRFRPGQGGQGAQGAVRDQLGLRGREVALGVVGSPGEEGAQVGRVRPHAVVGAGLGAELVAQLPVQVHGPARAVPAHHPVQVVGDLPLRRSCPLLLRVRAAPVGEIVLDELGQRSRGGPGGPGLHPSGDDDGFLPSRAQGAPFRVAGGPIRLGPLEPVARLGPGGGVDLHRSDDLDRTAPGGHDVRLRR